MEIKGKSKIDIYCHIGQLTTWPCNQHRVIVSVERCSQTLVLPLTVSRDGGNTWEVPRPTGWAIPISGSHWKFPVATSWCMPGCMTPTSGTAQCHLTGERAATGVARTQPSMSPGALVACNLWRLPSWVTSSVANQMTAPSRCSHRNSYLLVRYIYIVFLKQCLIRFAGFMHSAAYQFNSTCCPIHVVFSNVCFILVKMQYVFIRHYLHCVCILVFQ